MHSRLFIAVLPPLALQEQIRSLQHECQERFHSRAALQSPPHITLQPPFTWLIGELSTLENSIADFCNRQRPFSIQCDGFGAFAPRVIFIQVIPSAALFTLRQGLLQQMAQIGIEQRDHRPFHPHLTVAFRDLKPAQFRQAWPEFQVRSHVCEFPVTHLTLLIHDGQRWQIDDAFPLRGCSTSGDGNGD